MATYTEHYNLIKPALNDKVNINNLNDNADAIDTALYNKVNTDETQNITTSAVNCMMSDGVTSVEDAIGELTKYANFGSGATVTITGSACLLIAQRSNSVTSNTVNVVALCEHGNILYLVNSGGNTSSLSVSYSNGVTTITNENAIAVHFGVVVLNN